MAFLRKKKPFLSQKRRLRFYLSLHELEIREL